MFNFELKFPTYKDWKASSSKETQLHGIGINY